MIQIDDVIISDEVANLRFACDFGRCKGSCCKYGERGAPLLDEEARQIQTFLPNLTGFLLPKIQEILSNGIAEEFNGRLFIKEIGKDVPCPLSFKNHEDVILCSLHKYALNVGLEVQKIKPLWCRLFPLVVAPYGSGWKINVVIPDFCVSTPSPPHILEFLFKDLVSVFGLAWGKKLLQIIK